MKIIILGSIITSAFGEENKYKDFKFKRDNSGGVHVNHLFNFNNEKDLRIADAPINPDISNLLDDKLRNVKDIVPMEALKKHFSRIYDRDILLGSILLRYLKNVDWYKGVDPMEGDRYATKNGNNFRIDPDNFNEFSKEGKVSAILAFLLTFTKSLAFENSKTGYSLHRKLGVLNYEFHLEHISNAIKNLMTHEFILADETKTSVQQFRTDAMAVKAPEKDSQNSGVPVIKYWGKAFLNEESIYQFETENEKFDFRYNTVSKPYVLDLWMGYKVHRLITMGYNLKKRNFVQPLLSRSMPFYYYDVSEFLNPIANPSLHLNYREHSARIFIDQYGDLNRTEKNTNKIEQICEALQDEKSEKKKLYVRYIGNRIYDFADNSHKSFMHGRYSEISKWVIPSKTNMEECVDFINGFANDIKQNREFKNF